MCDTENLKIYNQCREVPTEAQKEIKGGRLKGMTDINPMWRIKKLTEVFGVCGFGWIIDNEKYTFQESHPTGEVAVIYELDLKVKYNGEWSLPIKGIGGAMFVAREKEGLYCDDEAIKKAKTDALSVACKALGIGANVYWSKDNESKYGEEPEQPTPPVPKQAPKSTDKKPASETKLSKYKQIAALFKEYPDWNMESVNAWIIAMLGKDCRVNNLPDDVFEELVGAIRNHE